MNIAIIGATGKVGQTFIKVLEEREIKADNFYLYASQKSAGKLIKIFGKETSVLSLSKENIIDKKIDFALFSAGASISKEFAPLFVSIGAVVIDNSSAWRRDENVPLVVPEVNSEDLLSHNGIIANPNCSTIQAMLPLKALEGFGLKRVIFSTYQAVSGAGQRGTLDLENGIKGESPQKFIHPIFSNVIPHIDDFLPNGYTKEEDKMIFETRKILHAPNLKITATAVRVPVFNAHSESVNVQLNSPFTLSDIKQAFAKIPNLIIQDSPQDNLYPMPIFCDGKDEVFVGRIRKDESAENALNFWVVSDNIRKGAATNAVQILQKILEYKAEGKL